MSEPTVPPFHGNISFNAQHSPMGAFFSFTCGQFGSRGGFGLQIGKPGNQNLYIGVKDGDRFSDSPLKCLPFFEGADADEAARFDVEKKSGEAKRPGLVSYSRDDIKRYYGSTVDRWQTKDLEFAIFTPYGETPNPAVSTDVDTYVSGSATLRQLPMLPAVTAKLVIDNRAGTTTKTAVFAIQFPAGQLRQITQGLLHGHVGFANGKEMGFAVTGWPHPYTTLNRPQQELIPFQRWNVADGVAAKHPIHQLGNCGGVAVEVPAGETVKLAIVLGVYLNDVVTTGLEGKYLYTRHFAGLTDVLNRGFYFADFELHSNYDRPLLESGLSPDQQFMIAHATRSYYGSTQLLDVGGEPFWVVNEGEYCMMNTLDLSVDHVFWELKQNPWVVKNLLDNFVRHYSYVDTVGGPGEEKTRPGGISFTHDMGVHNNFSPKGYSSYELPHLNAVCFGYMTAEQLCNWILIAASYVAKTNDLAWARQNQHVIEACLQSLINRTDASGFPAFDSSRCEKDGAEITTYDSLDHSLAQTRNNLYMVVKAWASFRGLELLLNRLGNPRGETAKSKAATVEKELPKRASENGVFPAVFEKENSGYTSRILPAVEGLMYPLYWGTLTPSPFVEALKKHTVALLKDGQNVFPDGGIKLSSTSNNSWMSKIAIFMHVCRKVFNLDADPQIKALFAKADAAHVKWQTEGESAYWACSDQFVNGVAMGSKYYPRIITSALWIE